MPTGTSERNQQIAYGLSNNFVRLLNEFAKDFESRVLAEIHARGYTDIRHSHSSVFNNLGLGAVRVTELAERAQVTQQAMGKMLKEIERLGYIARDIDTVDKRAKDIRLTEKGIKMAEECLAAVTRVRESYARQIGVKELDQLEVALRNAVGKINLSYLPESWTADNQ